MKKILSLSFLLVFVFLLSACSSDRTAQDVLGTDETPVKTEDSDLILFYGTTCPHCKDVDKFIEENRIEEKLAIDHKEVYFNKENSRIFQEKLAGCKIDPKTAGVPLLWEKETGGCFMGGDVVIKFLEKKAASLGEKEIEPGDVSEQSDSGETSGEVSE